MTTELTGPEDERLREPMMTREVCDEFLALMDHFYDRADRTPADPRGKEFADRTLKLMRKLQAREAEILAAPRAFVMRYEERMAKRLAETVIAAFRGEGSRAPA